MNISKRETKRKKHNTYNAKITRFFIEHNHFPRNVRLSPLSDCKADQTIPTPLYCSTEVLDTREVGFAGRLPLPKYYVFSIERFQQVSGTNMLIIIT
jgi:hypothetical protein